MKANIGIIFSSEGPLGGFIQIVVNRFQRHFAAAERLVKTLYLRDHLNDQTGADHEEIPPWACSFFVLFDTPTRSGQAAQDRDQRRTTVTNLIGRQAPLGTRGNGPATLRTKTLRNNGSREMRQQVIGGVDVERTDAKNDQAPPSPLNDLAEGSGDVEQRVPAPRRRFGNGTRRTNVHLTHLNPGFDATNNDPGMRFGHLSGAYGSLSKVAAAITSSLNALVPAPPVPRRNIIDVARDHREINNFLTGTVDESSRQLYCELMRGLAAEGSSLAQSFGSNQSNNNNDNENNENVSLAYSA